MRLTASLAIGALLILARSKNLRRACAQQAAQADAYAGFNRLYETGRKPGPSPSRPRRSCAKSCRRSTGPPRRS
jgi:hypothetical protein